MNHTMYKINVYISTYLDEPAEKQLIHRVVVAMLCHNLNEWNGYLYTTQSDTYCTLYW